MPWGTASLLAPWVVWRLGHLEERCCPCEHQALTLVRLSLWSCVPQGVLLSLPLSGPLQTQLTFSSPTSTLDTKEAPNAMADVDTTPSKAHWFFRGPWCQGLRVQSKKWFLAHSLLLSHAPAFLYQE